MSKNLTNLLLALGLLCVVTACVCPSDRDVDRNRDETPQAESTPAKESAAGKPAAMNLKNDDGDFIVVHEPVTNQRYAEIDRQVKQEKLLEKAADRLNRSLILPKDIELRTKDCNEVNAFYNPNDSSVTVCYELMEHFFKVFRVGGMDEQTSYTKMFDAVRFVFLHEIGHALIETYQLPITGNEEDAADRCSSFINIEELGDDGVKAVFAAADAFLIESKHSTADSRSMADEHLLQEQRFYNSLCMIYGSNTERYSMIVDEGYLPKERAVRCSSEYQRTVASWINLLEPWRK